MFRRRFDCKRLSAWAVRCLLMVVGLTIAGAAPAVGTVVLNESEIPLESDADCGEALLPASTDVESPSREGRRDSDALAGTERSPLKRGDETANRVTGHRLSNGLSAPIRC